MAEANELNDSTILQGTTQEAGERGTVRYRYTLPSGHKIYSEWVAADNQKKALRKWVDVVREQWVLDVDELARKKSQAKVEATPGQLSYEALAARKVDKTLDPLEHAKNQVVLLEAEVKHWSGELVIADKHLTVAKDKLAKWNQIIAAFAAGETNDK